MIDIQRLIFDWAAGQEALTGLVLLGLGLVYGFFGFRYFRFLQVVTCVAVGWLGGAWLGGLLELPPVAVAGAGAVVGGAVAVGLEKPGVMVSSAATCAGLFYYLGVQLDLLEPVLLILTSVAGVLGIVFAVICYRTMKVVLTAMQGAALMVVGFVSVSSHTLPSLGSTFCSWANSWSLLVPVFLTMIVATAYSYQMMQSSGDIKTGR